MIYEGREPTNKTVIDAFKEEPDLFDLDDIVPKAVHRFRNFIGKFFD